MSGINCAMVGAGGGVNLVTVGEYIDYFYGFTTYGYVNNGFPNEYGLIQPSTWPVTGDTIVNLYWIDNGTYQGITFQIQDTSKTESWNSMTIGSTTYLRTSATRGSSGGVIQFTWTPVAVNPFGTTVGATKQVIWA